MTSPLRQAISQWLQTHPGCFDADSEDDVFAFAYESFPARDRFTLEQFRDGIERAGYTPRAAHVHDGSDRQYFRLALPEGFGGV